jgi:UrcA family protein
MNMQTLEFRSFFAPAPATSTIVRPARTNRAVYGLALAATFVAFAAPALAADRETSARIAHGDLNLATESGVASLDRRIDQALGTLCRDQGVLPLYDQLASAKCRRMAAASVQPQRDALVKAAQQRQRVAAR